MRNFWKGVGQSLIALVILVVFCIVLLASGTVHYWMVALVGSVVLVLSTIALRKKSTPMLLISIVISSVLFYVLLGVSCLISFVFKKLGLLITYLIDQGEALMTYFTNIGHSWVNYVIIGLLVLIGLTIVKKNWKRFWRLVKRIWNFFAKLRVTTPIDEFHIVVFSGLLWTRKIAVYSGNDISGRMNKDGKKTESAKAYAGNFYWNLQKIEVLNHLWGMKVQIVASDDLKKAVRNINVKTKDLAPMNIGAAFIHFIVDDVLTAAKMWPGKDTDPEIFIESVTDIIEETVEIVTKDFETEELIGGSREVNEAFRKELALKLEEVYGIKIFNAKLSQENGEVVDLIMAARKEAFRMKKEIATEKADEKINLAKESKQQAIEIAKNTTQEKVNIKNLTEADGRKAVIEKDTEAEALRIRTILTAQATKEGLFKATNPIAARIEIAKAFSDIYKNAKTIVNSGGGTGDLIGNFLAIGKSLGIDPESVKAIAGEANAT